MHCSSSLVRSFSRICCGPLQKAANFSTTCTNFFPKLEVEGVGLNYEVVGNGPHTILCIPGLVGTIETDFGRFFKKVDKERFTWIATDAPGCGKSRPPNRDFTWGYALKDAHYAAKLMKELGYEKYSVFGWSQGGATGLFLASEYPESITNLVTLGTGSCNDERVIRIYEVISNIDYWPPERLKEMLEVYDKAYLRKMLKENYKTHKASLTAPCRGEYLCEYADKITCPIIHMNGEADTTCTKNHAHGLKERIKNSKNSRVIIIPKAGHDLHCTHTKQFLDIVEPFFLNEK